MENKLHFLLIHGSWHGSWAWENVRSKLSEKNFEVSCLKRIRLIVVLVGSCVSWYEKQ